MEDYVELNQTLYHCVVNIVWSNLNNNNTFEKNGKSAKCNKNKILVFSIKGQICN